MREAGVYRDTRTAIVGSKTQGGADWAGPSLSPWSLSPGTACIAVLRSSMHPCAAAPHPLRCCSCPMNCPQARPRACALLRRRLSLSRTLPSTHPARTVATTAEVELDPPDSILTAGSISRSPMMRRLGGCDGATTAATAAAVAGCWLCGGRGGQVAPWRPEGLPPAGPAWAEVAATAAAFLCASTSMSTAVLQTCVCGGGMV